MRLGSYYRSLLAARLGITVANGLRVLEVGAADTQLLQTLHASRSLALDPMPIRQNIVPFVRADGRFAPLKSESFDVVIAFDVLEHVQEDTQLMGELFRVVKAGFAHKRKQLWRNLALKIALPADQIKRMLRDVTGNEQIRAQELSVEQWEQITLTLKHLTT